MAGAELTMETLTLNSSTTAVGAGMGKAEMQVNFVSDVSLTSYAVCVYTYCVCAHVVCVCMLLLSHGCLCCLSAPHSTVGRILGQHETDSFWSFLIAFSLAIGRFAVVLMLTLAAGTYIPS